MAQPGHGVAIIYYDNCGRLLRETDARDFRAGAVLCRECAATLPTPRPERPCGGAPQIRRTSTLLPLFGVAFAVGSALGGLAVVMGAGAGDPRGRPP